jgi:hypothetical protein
LYLQYIKKRLLSDEDKKIVKSVQVTGTLNRENYEMLTSNPKYAFITMVSDTSSVGRTIAQAASRRLPTLAVRVRC